MSKKQTKTKKEPLVPTEAESEEKVEVVEDNQLDRPWWVDRAYWETLSTEEKEQFIQQKQ